MGAAAALPPPAAGAVHVVAARPPCQCHPPEIVLLSNARRLAAPKQWAGGRGIPIITPHLVGAGIVVSFAFGTEHNVWSRMPMAPRAAVAGGWPARPPLERQERFRQQQCQQMDVCALQSAMTCCGSPFDFTARIAARLAAVFQRARPCFWHVDYSSCMHQNWHVHMNMRVSASCGTTYGGKQNALQSCSAAASRLACRAAGRPNELTRRLPFL